MIDFFGALLRGDFDSAAALLDPDVTWQGLREDWVCHGREEVLHTFRRGLEKRREDDTLEFTRGEQVVLGARGPSRSSHGTARRKLHDVRVTFQNDARVSSDTLDENNANDLATTITTVALSADLALTFTSAQPTAKPSSTIHYKVTVDNLGPSDADGVVVTVNLPPAKSGHYVSDDGGCTLSDVTLSCPLGTVVAGSPTRTIFVDWFVQGAKFPVVASASVASPTPDPVAANNSATVTVTKQ